MTMSEYRVIIADGNAQFRHTTAEFFRTDKEIIRVEEATDGQAALEKMREEHFDVLITELVMPKLDGLDLLDQLRIESAHRPSVIIVVSYMRNDNLLQRSFAKGAGYVMLKPVEPEFLYRRMRDLLETCVNERTSVLHRLPQSKALMKKSPPFSSPSAFPLILRDTIFSAKLFAWSIINPSLSAKSPRSFTPALQNGSTRPRAKSNAQFVTQLR